MHSQSYRHNWSIVHIYSMNLKGRRIHSLHFYLFNLNSSKKGGVLWHFQCLVFENMCRCQYSTYLKKIHFCSAQIYQGYNSEETKIITYSSKRYSLKSWVTFFDLLYYGRTILTVFKLQYILFGTWFFHWILTKILIKNEILILVTNFDLPKNLRWYISTYFTYLLVQLETYHFC